MTDGLEIRIRIAEDELRREAEAAGQSLREGIGGQPVPINIDTTTAAAEIQSLGAQLLSAQAALADGTDAIALQQQAASLQESLRYKQQLAAIEGAGLSEEDVQRAKQLADELNRVNTQRLERDFGELRKAAEEDLTGILGLVNNLVEGIGQGLGQGLLSNATGLFEGIPDFLSESVDKATSLQRVLAGVEGTIRATGGAAGVSAQEIDALAQELGRSTLTNREAVLTASRTLLTFKSVQEETFGRAIRLANDLSETLGTDLKASTLQLGKVLENPITGLNALVRSGVTFTVEQEAQIKNLVEQNKLLEAQELILDTLEGQVGGVAEAAAAGLGGSLDTFAEELDQLQTTIGRDLADFFVPLVNTGAEAIATVRELVEGFVALPAPVKLTLLGVTGFTGALAAGVIALTAYQLAIGTTAAQLLKNNVLQLKATLIQSKDTVVTGAATIAKTAYAIATGKATAAQIAFFTSIAPAIPILIALAAAIKGIQLAADQLQKSFNNVDITGFIAGAEANLNNAFNAAGRTANLVDEINAARARGSAIAEDEIQKAIRLRDANNERLEVLRQELETIQAMRAVGAPQINAQANLVRQYESGIAALEAQNEQLEKAGNLLERNADAGAQGTLVGVLFEEWQERVEAEREARLDAIDQVNRLEETERARNQTDAIAAVRAQAAARVISEEEAQRQIAAIKQQGLDAELAAIQVQLDQVTQLRADRIITEADATQQISDLEARASSIRLEQIEATAQAEEAVRRARLNAIQEAIQLEATQRGTAENEAIAAVREQVAFRILTEEDAQRQIAAIRQRGLDDELASIENQANQIRQLQAEGILESEDAVQRLANLESRASDLRLQQIEADISANEEKRSLEIERLDEISEREQSIANARSAALDTQIQGLQQESNLLSARAGLQQAEFDRANQRLSIQIAQAEEAGKARLVEQLTSQLLEQQTVQLAEQQEVEREQLRLSQEQAAIELQRQSVLAAIATLEADIAIQQAVARDASAAELENLQRVLELRWQQEQFITDQVAAQEQLNQLANQELATRQAIAQEAQAAAREAEAASSGGRGGGSGGSSGGGGTGGLLGREVALYQTATKELQELIRGGADLQRLIRFAEGGGDAQNKDLRQRALANSAANDVLQFVEPVSQSDIARVVGTETAKSNARLNENFQSLQREIAQMNSSPRSVTVQSANPLGEVGNVISQLRRAELRAFGL